MALMMGRLYEALREAHVPDQTAREAAEEVAGYENRLSHIESRLMLLSWMMGVVIILLSGLFWQGFTIMGRLPR
jgi:hypothetical protein